MVIRSEADAVRYLEAFIDHERTRSFDYEKLGPGRARALCEAISSPHAGLPCVHIAGSKGKGSTALACEALLRAAGLRVGTFTSPHLEHWRERFRVDGEPVAGARLAEALEKMRPALERLRGDPELRPSFFDVSTALALALFRDAGVDTGVIEVGLGGRLDSTNVVEARVSVLTSVQLEHTDKLGTTLGAIAGEKAGILRPGVPLVRGPLEPEARAVVEASARALGCPHEEVSLQSVDSDRSGLRARLADGRSLRAPVLGRHQAVNLACAVRATERFLGRALAQGELAALEQLALPARVEPLGGAILDSAHSPDSARALREALDALWPQRPRVLLVSVSSDKDVDGVLRELAPGVRAAVATRAEPSRSLDPTALAGRARAAGIPRVEVELDPVGALARARQLAGDDALLVVAGSVYLAGAVRGPLAGTVFSS